MIGFGFTSDWLRKWREIFEPITKRSNAKPKQTQFTFDTQVKTALSEFIRPKLCHGIFLLCSYDYVKITNDKNETLGVYCGQNAGHELRLTGRHAVIIFHSDYSFQKRGFLLVFSFTPTCKYNQSFFVHCRGKICQVKEICMKLAN